MTFDPTEEDLKDKPLYYFQNLFSTLAPPKLEDLMGVHQGMFTGPRWLRSIASPSLGFFGLAGWWGKEFKSGRHGTNIVIKRYMFSRVLAFEVKQIQSLVDGNHGITLRYTQGAWFPWTHVYDEIRMLDETRMLGMTITNLKGLRNLALPFLLFKQESIDGL